MDLFEIEKVEVFAVGKWNGFEFSSNDLNSIVSSFNLLGDNQKVPLKFGHNDKQPLKVDGDIALGWVESLSVEQGADKTPKLMAKLVDLPKIVYNSIVKKLYRKVSIELDIDVKYKGKHLDYVLSGIALLGSDLPAVNTLADISHYMSKSLFSSSKKLCFSAIKVNDKLIKESIMDFTQDQLNAALEKQAKELELKFSKESKDSELQLELEAQKVKVAKFEKEKADFAKAEKAKKIELKREEIVNVLNEGVKAMSITPAQSESFSKLLGLETDAVLDIDIENVKALIGKSDSKFDKDKSKNKQNKKSGDNITAGEELDEKAKEYQDDHPKVKYSRALEVVMSKNKDMAKEHVNATCGGAE